jgi:hypothetical protein
VNIARQTEETRRRRVTPHGALKEACEQGEKRHCRCLWASRRHEPRSEHCASHCTPKCMACLTDCPTLMVVKGPSEM